MRFLIKIITIPVILVLSFAELVLNGTTRIYCYFAGFAINILIVLAVLAIVTRQWLALVIQGGLLVVCVATIFAIGMVSVVLNGIKEKIKRI